MYSRNGVYFLTSIELTPTTVIIRLHRGMYKSCARDDTLTTMQMIILSLAFKFGLKGVARWHNTVDYILEKGKGPILGKL